MRLRVRYKEPPKPKKKKKDTNEKCKAIRPKLCKNYRSVKPFATADCTIDITKLTYGAIESHELVSVTIYDDEIKLEESWIQIILLMLYKLIQDSPSKFLAELAEKEVTNSKFIVDKIYGRYSLDPKLLYKAYNIYNTGYYLEAVFDMENIFNSIVGLSLCLDIDCKAFNMHIVKHGYNNIKLSFDSLKEEEVIANLDNAGKFFKKGVYLSEIKFFDKASYIHNINVAFAMFCNILAERYGEDELSSIENYNNTGLCIGEAPNGLKGVNIHNTAYTMYTDGETIDILVFMKNCLETLEISDNVIKFKFRMLKSKENLKEWEVD